MTTVVVDASAGAELVTDTPRSAQLRAILPSGATLAVPNHFHVEVAGVIRRLELRGVLTSQKAAEALDELIRWPLHAAAVTPLLRTAWTYRNNLTVSDALYIALAERLGASLLTDDRRLANAPTFPASVPKLMLP